MSPKFLNTSSGKGRRTPGKPGRFDPSEPLHMTTRHAARNGLVNSTPSLNGSADGNESRRGSLDDIRPVVSYGLSNIHNAKGRRASRTSLQDAPDMNRSFEMMPSDQSQTGRSKSKPISPTLHPLSPSRKRKSSSPTPPDTPDGTFRPIESSMGVALDPYEDDFLGTVPASQLSDGDGSVITATSDEQDQQHYAAITQSTEFTPAASEAVSPASEETNDDLVSPEKQANVALIETGPTLQPETDDVEDIVEAEDIEAEVDVEEADVDADDDVDDQVRADGDGRTRRRFAGRRRADHPIPEIEAMLRRQLKLKSAFRNISRALKPVLAELAQKTIEDLGSNRYLHEQVVEYTGNEDLEGVQRQLDDALEKRKRQLHAQLKWNEVQLAATYKAATTIRNSGCELQIEDARQVQVDRLEHDFLKIARRAQMATGDPGYETEDEDDDVLPKLKGMAYRFQRKEALDPRFDSRSRMAMETESAVEDLRARFEMHRMLQDLDQDTKPDRYNNFTVMDAGPRDAAIARRESLLSTRMLAEAAVEFERISSIPIIPNEEALGLQMLGDLASRPSIRASTAAASPARFDKDTPPNFTPFPHHVHLHRPPLAYDGPNFDMSPRSQPHQERFGHHLFPPATPKYPKISEKIREPRMLSPTFSPSRTNMLAPLAVRPIDDEHVAPPESPPRYHRPIEHLERNPSRSDMIDPALRSMQYRAEPTSHRPSNIDPALYNLHPLDRPPTDFPKTAPEVSEKLDISGNGTATRALRKVAGDDSPRSAAAMPKPTTVEMLDDLPPADMDHQDEPSSEKPAELSVDVVKAIGSRNSSVSQSATDVSPDGSRAGDSQRRSKQKSGKGQNTSSKPNKADKNGGIGRRVWKSYRYENKRGSPPVETSGPAIHRFRLNSVEQTQSQPAPQPSLPPFSSHPQMAVWHPGYYYPSHDPYGPPPPPHFAPSVAFAPPPPPPPPPPSYPYGPYSYDFGPQYQHQHHHRNSFSGPPHSWPQQPGSPLYAVPHAPPPDQWQQQGAPVSHMGPQTPTTSQAQIAQGSSYGQQYPGPPIAPATSDHRYTVYGTAQPQPQQQSQPQQQLQQPQANHPPAFAQQQRQSDGGQRRRTQSDAQNRFQHWAPRPS